MEGCAWDIRSCGEWPGGRCTVRAHLAARLRRGSEAGRVGAGEVTVRPDEQVVVSTLYLLTFALDSVGDIFGSLFAFATGLLVIGSGVLPRWLGWVSLLAGILLFL
jgi:hypothetical protein